jgi:uncharacterized protein YggT (Ycf19 family)
MGKEDKMTDYKEVSTTEHESGHEGRVATFKATQLIWLLLGILEAVLALRFVFKLIGVNAANPFASFLYGLTNFFVAPFASLTGAPAAGGMVFEFSTLIAMLVYALVAWAIERLVYVIFYRPRGPVSVRQTTVDQHIPAATSSSSQTTTTTTDHNTKI